MCGRARLVSTHDRRLSIITRVIFHGHENWYNVAEIRSCQSYLVSQVLSGSFRERCCFKSFRKWSSKLSVHSFRMCCLPLNYVGGKFSLINICLSKAWGASSFLTFFLHLSRLRPSIPFLVVVGRVQFWSLMLNFTKTTTEIFSLNLSANSMSLLLSLIKIIYLVCWLIVVDLTRIIIYPIYNIINLCLTIVSKVCAFGKVSPN